jgi:hypothetical protein
MSFVLGILGIALGIVLIIKTEWFLENFGTISWAEEHMGSSGGSRLMYKLVGLAFIVIALMAMTGLLGTVILSTFGRLFGAPV